MGAIHGLEGYSRPHIDIIIIFPTGLTVHAVWHHFNYVYMHAFIVYVDAIKIISIVLLGNWDPDGSERADSEPRSDPPTFKIIKLFPMTSPATWLLV